MDATAINQHYAARRDDGRWGIANDYTGRSRYEGPGYETEAEALAAADEMDRN